MEESPSPAPQSKPVTPAARLVARTAPLVAFGLGLRILAAGPAPIPTILRFRALCEPIPKFVAMNQELGRGDERSAKSVGYTPRKGVWSFEGRYRPLLLESSRRPPAGKTCLSSTSRAVSSKATETPFTSRTRPDLRGSW